MDGSFSLTLATPPTGSADLYIVVVDSWAKKRPQKGSLAIMAVSLRAVLRSPLVEGRTYTATLQPGIADLAGNVRGQSFAWTFHTTQMEIWHLYLPLIQR